MKWFALTLGGTLVGFATWVLLQDENSPLRKLRRTKPPVAKLAEQLQHAWVEPHNTAV